MQKSFVLFMVLAFVIFASSALYASSTGIAKGTPIKTPAKPINVESCFNGCHDTVKLLYERGGHSKVNCGMCHEVKPAHITNPSEDNRPVVRTDHRSCATCHDKELQSMLDTTLHMNWAKNNMPSYGMIQNPETGVFQQVQTRIPRYHIGMLADIIVNRTGGRFQYKNPYDIGKPIEKVWEKIYDTRPDDGNDVKVYERTHAWRAQKSIGVVSVVTCMKCKTTDNMLDYAYLRDENSGAKLNKNSKSLPALKDMNQSFNCNFCHDPHSAEPRIVNDMLIDALINPLYKNNLYQTTPTLTKVEVIDMGERGYTRKIAILDKYDSQYMCGQCHSAPDPSLGLRDLSGGETFAKAPFVKSEVPAFVAGPIETYKYYQNKQWFNGINPTSGTLFINPTHPQVELAVQSVHGKAGVGCTDCHYGKEKNKNSTYSNHQVSLPKDKVAKTCLRSDCHGIGTKANWKTDGEARYAIELIQQKAKIRIKELNSSISNAVLFIKDINTGLYSLEKPILDELQNVLGMAMTVDAYWFGDYSLGVHNPKLYEDSVTAAVKDLNAALAKAKLKITGLKK